MHYFRCIKCLEVTISDFVIPYDILRRYFKKLPVMKKLSVTKKLPVMKKTSVMKKLTVTKIIKL